MKKLIPALVITGMMSSLLISCGPSAEEKAAAEQYMRDSIALVEKAKADSIIAVQQQVMMDSLALVKMTEDSIASAKAVEDSLKAVKSSRPRTKPKPTEPTKPTEVKPGQGRD